MAADPVVAGLPEGFVLESRSGSNANAKPSASASLPPGFVLEQPEARTSERAEAPDAPEGGVSHGEIYATPEPSGLAERFERWSQQLAHDLRRGTDVTLPGKIMKFLGAPGLDKGVSPGTADFMGSPLLGPVRVMEGGAQMAQGAAEDNSPIPSPIPLNAKGAKGAGNVVGGVMDTLTIPAAFVAPEMSEVAALKAGRGAKQAAGAVKQAFSKTAVTKNMGTELAGSLDRVASEAGLPASKATSLSGKADEVVAGLKGQAQEIYGQLDKASGGRYQRFRDEIESLTDALRNKYADPDQKAKWTDRLVKVRQDLAGTQKSLIDQGVDPATIKAADAKWAQAKALEKVGKTFKAGEFYGGEMKPSTASVDTGMKNLKPHTLPQAVKGEAGAIRESVINATKKTAKVKRNQRVAAALGGSGAVLGGGAKIISVLSSRE